MEKNSMPPCLMPCASCLHRKVGQEQGVLENIANATLVNGKIYFCLAVVEQFTANTNAAIAGLFEPGDDLTGSISPHRTGRKGGDPWPSFKFTSSVKFGRDCLTEISIMACLSFAG